MRKTSFILLMLLFVLTSCQKEYRITYLNEKEESIKEDSFLSESDTSAYLYAYEQYCIAQKVEKEMKDKYGGEEKTKDFKLYNESGNVITGEGIQDLKSKEDKIRKNINELGDLIDGGEKEKIKVDSTTVKELTPYFDIVSDEFDINNTKFWMPKGRPKYIDRNWIYIYFSEVGERVGNLTIKIQYTADNWLFIRKYIFNIDGYPIEMLPNEVKRDNGNGKIWEWCDQRITASEAILIENLETAKVVKIKFEGDKYSDVRTLSNKEVEDMKRTISLYKAKGGSI